MKKITAMILALVMLLCVFTLPCAASVTSDINVDVEFDLETKTVSVSGITSVTYGVKWVTYYLLYPGKTQDDIPSDSAENPVVSQYGQMKVGTDGTFSDSFQYVGDSGVYTLYITSGSATKEIAVDTTKDISKASGSLAELYALPTTYGAPAGTTTKEVFEERVAELPDEMPIVSPAEINGLYEIYVDVQNGNDSTATGSIDKPYKTITEALLDFPPESGMVLVLREGTYPISDALRISNLTATEKNPFIVTNYENEKVVVAGGDQIDGKAFTNITDGEVLARLDPSVIDKVLVADLKAMGINDYGEITSSNSPVLFVGDSKYQIARWPNSEMTVMRMADSAVADTNNGTASAINGVVTNGVIDSGAITTGIGSNCGQYRKYSRRGQEQGTEDKGAEFCVEDITPFSWVDTGEIWMYGSFYEEWAKSTVRISEFNPETRSIRLASLNNGWGCRYSSGNKFYYYNIFEELDAPGEWFLDKESGKLYVYPITDIENESILYAASPSNMWSLTNVKNVIINGITFEHARSGALNIEGGDKTEGVIVQNCSFENVGTGVTMAAKYSGVINSNFKNINGNGISLVGTYSNTTTMTPNRLFAQNNKLYSTKGIRVSGIGNIISHNFVSNNVGSAIYLAGGREIIAEYNEIVGGPRETLDSGVFYVNGNNHFTRGHHIRYNYIHNVGSTSPRGIYFDDMLSECYAYGNIVDGNGMQIHNGSEVVVYNNVFLNSTRSINDQPNYYKGWAIRWQKGSLEYGSVTQGLEGFKYGDTLDNAVFTRYPALKKWAELMLKRIAEYEGTIEGIGKGVVSGSNYDSEYVPSDYYTDGSETPYNLDQYLRASRDLYVANNVLVNTVTPKLNQGASIEESKENQAWDGYTGYAGGGIIRTTYENNQKFATAENPFADGYDDESVYENLGIEAIPFEKMGITSDVPKYVNAKTTVLSPASTTSATVSKSDLSLSWRAVEGAQLYTVEVATDEAFSNIIASAETRDMSCGVDEAVLSDDTTYYWRVKTTSQGNGSTGSTLTSDTFVFKTHASEASASSDNHNKFGITDYNLTNSDGDEVTPDAGEFIISAYAYNITSAAKDATVYAAMYDENDKFIKLAKADVTSAADDFSEKIEISVSAPGVKKVKFFVWSADGNMIPYSFVKTIE